VSVPAESANSSWINSTYPPSYIISILILEHGIQKPLEKKQEPVVGKEEDIKTA
jgi:hypothetical protein